MEKSLKFSVIPEQHFLWAFCYWGKITFWNLRKNADLSVSNMTDLCEKFFYPCYVKPT
jgi:hypothetical protein